MRPPNQSIAVIIIIAYCFVTRLPQLVSPNLILDGDECVVALIAKYIYTGKEFSMYFWGQDYGFSLVEVAFILPFYALLGVTTVSVKLAMLSLWSVGVVFLYRSMSTLHSRHTWLPFLLIILFISMPAWAVWSMKARGGYLTAFALSSMVMYLIFRNRSRNVATYVVIGILIELIYESQPLFLTGVAPLVVYFLVKEKNFKGFAAFTVAVMVPFTLLLYYKNNFLQQFHPPRFIPSLESLPFYIKRFPEYLSGSLHGNYYFAFFDNPDLFSVVSALICAILIYTLFILALYHSIFKRHGNLLFIFACVHIPLIFVSSLFSVMMEGRYLLPVMGFSIFALYTYLYRLQSIKPARQAIIARLNKPL